MFRPEDFAELTTRPRPIGRGTFSSWRVHPSSARRGISSPMQDSSEFKISSCLNSGCVKYVDALVRRGGSAQTGWSLTNCAAHFVDVASPFTRRGIRLLEHAGQFIQP